jgi:orotate phosphoribosyltransferase
VIDDVVTAGTAMRETLNLVAAQGGTVIGFVVAIDRMEKMTGSREKEGIDDGAPRRSALGQIRAEYGVPSASIATLDDLITVLRRKGDEADLKRVEEYRARYLASD